MAAGEVPRTGIGRGVCRVLDRYDPRQAVGLVAQGLDIAADGDYAGLDARSLHGAGGVHGGAAPAERGEGELHPNGQGEEVGVRIRHGGEGGGGEVHVFDQALYLVLGGDAVEPVHKAPGLDEGVDGGVEIAA